MEIIRKYVNRIKKVSEKIWGFSKKHIRNYPQKFLIFLIKRIRDIIILLFTFYIVAFGYKWILGVTRSNYTDNQIEEIIQQSLKNDKTNYETLKIDFHGFGSKSLVVITNVDYEEKYSYNETYLDEFFTFGSEDPLDPIKIIVFDKIQKDPIESFLFQGDLYKETFRFEPEIYETYTSFSRIQEISYNISKKRMLFCYMSQEEELCGTLQYDNDYKITPLIFDGDFPLISEELKVEYDKTNSNLKYLKNKKIYLSNGNMTELTSLDYPTEIDLRNNDTQLFIGVPIILTGEIFCTSCHFPYFICPYELDNNSYSLIFDHGASYCYKTEKEYNPSFFGELYYSDSNEVGGYTEYQKEIDSNKIPTNIRVF